MSTQHRKPTSIHVPGPKVHRGNRYSYHVAAPCSAFEDRSTRRAFSHPDDTCIGVDTFANPTLPSLFTPVPLPNVVWDDDALANGLRTHPTIAGSETAWDYLALAAGDVDGDLNDIADTWGISSGDALVSAFCQPDMISAPAGEPFPVHDESLNCS